jgi:hypothetical protein
MPCPASQDASDPSAHPCLRPPRYAASPKVGEGAAFLHQAASGSRRSRSGAPSDFVFVRWRAISVPWSQVIDRGSAGDVAEVITDGCRLGE